MKKWIVLLLFTQMSWPSGAQPLIDAFGGVDVGNGRVVAGMFEGFFPEEERLRSKVQLTLQEVKEGRHSRVLEWIAQGQCKQQMAYESTEIVTGFRPEGDGWQKGVLGYTRVVLKDCKTPYEIEADEPPLSDEDGFEE
jgi:hypothetical protein